MAPLTDPERKKHYFTALEAWGCEGYVILKPKSEERLTSDLDGYGFNMKLLRREMWACRDKVKEIREKRGYDDPFHYDFVLTAPDGRQVYVETVLDMRLDPTDSTIVIVSIHDPKE